ncbi:hypothetical protein E3N88_06948 [Mikania micrantha]|uniref:Uncharacterized protein n=1 Tax=Mikania micrantha TaxID=192012 RepID=A0A5N6PR73_9ASTR|nr:hypothetical protein E3N88_06948 [Mikania micrantha]
MVFGEDGGVNDLLRKRFVDEKATLNLSGALWILGKAIGIAPKDKLCEMCSVRWIHDHGKLQLPYLLRQLHNLLNELEMRRKPCVKRSYGLSGIAKRRKISKYGTSGLVAVRDREVEDSSRYAMGGKYLKFSGNLRGTRSPIWPLVATKNSYFGPPTFSLRPSDCGDRTWERIYMF